MSKSAYWIDVSLRRHTTRDGKRKKAWSRSRQELKETGSIPCITENSAVRYKNDSFDHQIRTVFD